MDSLDDLPNLSELVPDVDVVETLEAVLRGVDEQSQSQLADNSEDSDSAP